MISLNDMTTEKTNASTENLDTMSPLEIVQAMNQEDATVALSVQKVLPQIAQTVEWVVQSLRSGGRLIYMGAGTSGRLGVLDAVECPPTFGTSPDLVVGLIAGGERAFVKAVEGAEDSTTMGVEDLKALNLSAQDTVVGIAASGRTPYVVAALEYANGVGCNTVAISCNQGSAIGKAAKLAIEVEVGPEVLTGSTRLKAGTAQKMILNMISTASMVGVGKVYHNLMIDVQQTNAKLKVRAENIVMQVTDVSREQARETLDAAKGSVKLALVMLLQGCDAQTAEQKLVVSNGHVRGAL